MAKGDASVVASCAGGNGAEPVSLPGHSPLRTQPRFGAVQPWALLSQNSPHFARASLDPFVDSASVEPRGGESGQESQGGEPGAGARGQARENRRPVAAPVRSGAPHSHPLQGLVQYLTLGRVSSRCGPLSGPAQRRPRSAGGDLGCVETRDQRRLGAVRRDDAAESARAVGLTGFRGAKGRWPSWWRQRAREDDVSGQRPTPASRRSAVQCPGCSSRG